MNANWILNEDGSIYHLKLHAEDLADTIITVGDQNRVGKVSKYFDHIEIQKQNREFVTHTGRIGSKRMTVISTGIGTDNVDIVLNEMDALMNIDFNTGLPKPLFRKLKFYRIGTSGSIQKDIPLGSFLISEKAIGIDGLMSFYLKPEFDLAQYHPVLQNASLASYSESLADAFSDHHFIKGNTLTAAGFYAPQGRLTRANIIYPNLISELSSIEFPFGKISNLEMETAGIYGLANVLGHEAISLNAILANRVSNEFASNPEKVIDDMIQKILTKIIS